jgi:hypothetical protein
VLELVEVSAEVEEVAVLVELEDVENTIGVADVDSTSEVDVVEAILDSVGTGFATAAGTTFGLP